MQTVTKVGHIAFHHSDDFKGDVEITRGDQKLQVPMEALRRLVAESVRHELADHVSKMKPEALLRRIA
jgi:hypothetical protein